MFEAVFSTTVLHYTTPTFERIRFNSQKGLGVLDKRSSISLL